MAVLDDARRLLVKGCVDCPLTQMYQPFVHGAGERPGCLIRPGLFEGGAPGKAPSWCPLRRGAIVIELKEG